MEDKIIISLALLSLVVITFSFFLINKSLKIEKETVFLYYYNPELDRDAEGNILCSQRGLVPVARQIPINSNSIEKTINLLLQGELTSKERVQGIMTEYPLEGFSLIEAFLNKGNLTIVLNDPYNKTSGSSCRSKILWLQIEATAKQFSGIREVYFSPEYLFQP